MSGVTYTVILGPDGDDSGVNPTGINNSGVVIGSYQNASNTGLGFIDDGGTYTVLNGPDGDDTNVNPIGINSSGVVVGSYSNGSNIYSFIYNAGTYTALTGPGPGNAASVFAHGINASGEVIGNYQIGTDPSVGFIYDDGTYTALSGGPDGNDQSFDPIAINDSGEVVGTYETQSFISGVFTYSNGTYAAITDPTDASRGINVTGINNAGEIVGYYFNGNSYVGFIYDDGTYTDLTGPDGNSSFVEPTAINNSGEVTGYFYNGSKNVGFIYDDGTYTELDGPDSNDKSVEGNAINDSGTVAGIYDDSSFADHGVTAELCYLRGTRILTPTGMVAIEDVAIGDRVVTRFGGVRKIKWIGRQNYDSRFIKENPEKLPVCIHPGALGDDGPSQKLFVSPGHSLLIGDTLVLASALVNGVTVTQRYGEDIPAMIDYFQIELETHDCIIAEGIWAETYADAPGLRAQFHNEAEYYALYPDEPPAEELALCAPRPERGEKRTAALRQVAGMAEAYVTPGRFEGWIERISDWRIEGWAIDHDHPELPVLLEVVLGNEVIGTALACEEREDLVKAGIGNGRRAFFFSPASRLRPADWRDVTMRRASDGAALQMAGACRERLGPAAAPLLLLAAE